MRFHDIPDLPIRAFMHNGIKGKICLYKGGGDIVEWASDQLDETPVFSNPGETFANIDDAVNDNIPGGWATVGAVALAAATGYVDPSLLGSEVGAELGGEAALEAGAEGALEAGSEAVNAGLDATDLTSEFGNEFGTSEFNPTNPTEIYDFSPETPISNSPPELDPTGSMANSPLNNAYPTYDYSPNTPVSNAPPELDPTGSMADMANPSMSTSDIARALRLANTAKNILSPTASKTSVSQQPLGLNNLLRANQFTPVEAPPIYKAQNPFSFGQQQPIQDTNQLASLLRNNYGNS